MGPGLDAFRVAPGMGVWPSSHNKMSIIPISLGTRAYDVHIGAGLIARAGELIAPLAPSKRVFVVSDVNVATLHGAALSQSLEAAGLSAMGAVLAPGEEAKSFQWLEWLCATLIEQGIERRDLVVAFGGGVIGDLAGFAAGIVKRGVDFVQIPTTLLAQVDSSVGGKTGIDTPQGKNLVGLFHQPKLVIADLDVLSTLLPRELRAGYAEVVKYGLIGDPDFFAWCEANADTLLGVAPIPFDPGGNYDGIVAVNEGMRAARLDALAHAVRVSVETKARVVIADEREQGQRALLNLGHTFAHALEAHGGYTGALLHGEAVAAGMNLAFAFSQQLGLCSAADAERVRAHLHRAGFELDLRRLSGAPFDAEKLLTLMARDKKAEADRLTLILTRGIGQAFVDKNAPHEKLRDFLHQHTRITL